jgi:hypothetical protein
MSKYQVTSITEYDRVRLTQKVEEYVNNLSLQEQSTLNIQFQVTPVENVITHTVNNAQFFAFIYYIID